MLAARLQHDRPQALLAPATHALHETRQANLETGRSQYAAKLDQHAFVIASTTATATPAMKILDCAKQPLAEYVARRPGEPAVLVTSHARASNVLHWQPAKSLVDCVADALAWQRRQRG